MVYLVKDQDSVRSFYSESEMIAAGFAVAEKTVSEEVFNSNGCYARIIDDEIVVGKTPEEIAEEARQGEISDLKSQLEEIDRRSGASRHVRDISVSAGVVLDAVRILLFRVTEELEISIPEGFTDGLETAADILGKEPPENATPEQLEDFTVHKALALVNRFDPAINEGLQALRSAEAEAMPIREQLSPLLNAME